VRASLLITYNQYILKISYVGSQYKGWQIQPDGMETVQLQFHRAIEKLFPNKSYKFLASGRTDTGVHARGQVLSLKMEVGIEPVKLMKALNSTLPSDILILNVTSSEKDFHPIRDAEWKEYHYLFSTNRNVFLTDRVTFVSSELDYAGMSKGASAFVGEYDFSNFQCKGTEVQSTIRTIYESEIIKLAPQYFSYSSSDNIYCFRVRGEGFLKQMVRLMMGSLIQIGKGKATVAELKEALQPNGELVRVGPVAPAQGLYLDKVCYPHF